MIMESIIWALGNTILVKAQDKAGEKIVDGLFKKVESFLQSLGSKSPQTVKAIEGADRQPLDYGQAVLAIEQVANSDSEIANAIQELSLIANQQSSNPELDRILQKIRASIKPQQQTLEFSKKMADTIEFEKAVNFGETINIGEQNINF